MSEWVDLNEQMPETDGQGYERASGISTPLVNVWFSGLEGHLLDLILASDVVVGCVAWLTNETILRALIGKRVALVVQKEDFLRPDGPRPSHLRRLYGAIDDAAPYWDRYDLPGKASSLSVCGDPTFRSIRCVGNHNSAKHPAFPRMHHKFCVFGKWQPGPISAECESRGKASFHSVWTGSYNLTHNATRSLENAVVLRDPVIVEAYLGEWGHVFSLSEPLDWETAWCEPEWRIGT